MFNLLIALVLSVMPVTDAAPKPKAFIAACKFEDGSGQRLCVWDGRHRGSGSGRSYIVKRTGKNLQHERVAYVPHWVAHRLTR